MSTSGLASQENLLEDPGAGRTLMTRCDMPRDIPIGNGRLLVSFDLDYQIRDLYYPRVGKENHALGFPWRLGLWVSGLFYWIDRREWTIRCGYVPDTLVTEVTLSHPRLPLSFAFNDTVDYEKDIVVRRVRIASMADRSLELRLFFHADISCLENETGDTVFFDPKNSCLVHYKGPRYFLMSCSSASEIGVTHFAIGKKRQPDVEGTWRDAEDGELGGNPIAQGAVDSVIGIHLNLAPGQQTVCHYWIAAGKNYSQVQELHRFTAIDIQPDQLIERNIEYWRLWLSRSRGPALHLPPSLVELYNRSLLTIRTQIDQGGAILAANDSDVWQFNRDTYSYVWPRDGAIVSEVLDRAGYTHLSRRFLEFCTNLVSQFSFSASLMSETGFLMHKYNPDGSVGSSWHPWIADGQVQLPIQEDETAVVIWAIWRHYLESRDIEAIHTLYHPFVERAGDFLMGFRDEETGLPLPSYDLWEESRGIFSYTAATVVAGLRAAADLAALFCDFQRCESYRQGAEAIKGAIERHLYAPEHRRFLRGMIVDRNGELRKDLRLDASLLGLVQFGIFDPADERMVRTVSALEERLWSPGAVGGLCRYEGDVYHKPSDVPGTHGNPWIICTLWLAQYRIALARDDRSLEKAMPLLQWVAARSLTSGILPEQSHPGTGAGLSVSPLTWSHAAFVAAALDYAAKKRELLACDPTAAGPN